MDPPRQRVARRIAFGQVNVRVRSFAEVVAHRRHDRFTPITGNRQRRRLRLKSANWRSQLPVKQLRFDCALLAMRHDACIETVGPRLIAD